MDEKEKSLQVIENVSFLKKILNFLKNAFRTNKTSYYISNNQLTNEQNEKDNFIKSTKYTQDPDEERLLKIQDELEKRGINHENAYELTKDLSDSQKIKLENLYKEQIKNFENSIESSKNKIINIRKKST